VVSQRDRPPIEIGVNDVRSSSNRFGWAALAVSAVLVGVARMIGSAK
jgi:hypothetical protein